MFEFGDYFIMTTGALILFFVLRYVWLWYFRINDLVKRQDRIIELLEQMVPANEEATEDQQGNP